MGKLIEHNSALKYRIFAANMETKEQQDLVVYLSPAYFIDSDSPDVIAFAKKHTEGAATDIEKAVQLFYAVRDGFFYDPYNVDLSAEAMKGSATLKRGSGYCGEKATLLAAAARAVGIPSRLGFANVKNHLSTQKLLDLLRSDIFVFHGFSELFLNGKWVKATPAFNKSLCDKFGVAPLEFDGINDSIFHEFEGGKKFMEYLHDFGTFADVPRELFIASLQKHYPHLFDTNDVEHQKMGWKKQVF